MKTPRIVTVFDESWLKAQAIIDVASIVQVVAVPHRGHNGDAVPAHIDLVTQNGACTSLLRIEADFAEVCAWFDLTPGGQN